MSITDYQHFVPYLYLKPLKTFWIRSALSCSDFIRSSSSMVSWKS